jgi:acetolactate synthase-1/2/3 large subunit
MARPVTKGSWLLSDPRRIPEAFARAFRTALNGRRGPVHLTIPLDVQESAVDTSEIREDAYGDGRAERPAYADPKAIETAIELLRASERPLIVVANGAYTVQQDEIERLVETTGIPVFTEESARGIISDDHALCAGYADGRVGDAAKSIREADALLLLGKKLDYTISFGGPPTINPDTKIIQVEPAWVQRATWTSPSSPTREQSCVSSRMRQRSTHGPSTP